MITLFTAYTDTPEWNELADITVPVMQEYADKHGYKLVVKKEPQSSRHFPWTKTELVLKYLEGNDETMNPSVIVWVLDIDVLITNIFLPLDRFPLSPISMTRDINDMNTGSYFACNVNWAQQSVNAKKVLQDMLSLEGIATSENHAICILKKLSAYDGYIRELNHPSINSIPYHLYPEIGRREHSEGQWERGDLTCHLPGKTPQERCEIFKEISKEIVR